MRSAANASAASEALTSTCWARRPTHHSPPVASLRLRGILLSMVAFKGYFDGSVIVPSGKPDLPRGRELLFRVETPTTELTDGRDLLKHAGKLDEQSAREMMDAVNQECERIDNEW